MAYRPKENSPTQARKLFAAEQGAQALDDVAKKAVEVRKNMERLRALRLAKEADEIRQQIAASNAPAKPRGKKR